MPRATSGRAAGPGRARRPSRVRRSGRRRKSGNARFEPGGIAAVRGAVPVRVNTPDAILSATARLLNELVRVNRLEPKRIISALFTTTADLDAEFPAHAARRLGWGDVPMLHAREIPVPGSMPRVVRVLLTVRDVPAGTLLEPVYLDEAANLRPDLAARRSGRGALRAAPHGSEPSRPLTSTRRARSTRRIALIGLGQIGGSIGLALALHPEWHRVGWDSVPKTLARARAEGAVDQAARSLAAACAAADLAVIATPVDTLPGLIGRAARALPRGAALLDTGSARHGLGPALQDAASRGLRAVGGHPLAGSEGRGFAAARADLFRGASFALLPARGRVPAIVSRMVRDLGARPRVVSAALHDRALARTSHVPYLLARALRERGARYSLAGLSGPGFRDMTRLAGSDPRVAEGYCRANFDEVARAWDEVRRTMDRRLRSLRRR